MHTFHHGMQSAEATTLIEGLKATLDHTRFAWRVTRTLSQYQETIYELEHQSFVASNTLPGDNGWVRPIHRVRIRVYPVFQTTHVSLYQDIATRYVISIHTNGNVNVLHIDATGERLMECLIAGRSPASLDNNR
jgi:hypothetical protein